VANGFVSEYLKNKTVLSKIRHFRFNSNFLLKNLKKQGH